jgi:hypothetical protein
MCRQAVSAATWWSRRSAPAKLLGGAQVGEVKLRDLTWLDNDHLLIEVSSTSLPPIGFMGERQEWYQLLTFDVRDKKLAPVEFKVPDANTLNVIIGEPMVRIVAGATVLFVPGLYVADRTYPGLFFSSKPGTRSRMRIRSPWHWRRRI